MTRAEAEMVALLLPRYCRDSWTRKVVDGRRKVRAMTSLQMTPLPEAHRLLKRRKVRVTRIEKIDMRKENVWVLHRVLRPRTLLWAIRSWSKVQRVTAKSGKMPVVVRFRDGIVIWNGTHRTVASMLLGRPLRCEVDNRANRISLAAWVRSRR